MAPAGAKKKDTSKLKTAVLSIPLTENERQDYDSAAGKMNLETVSWARMILTTAAINREKEKKL